MQPNMRMRLIVCCFLLFWGMPLSPQAAPKLGVQFPAFQLQGLDSQFYGTQGAEGKISVLYFLGYNCAPCVGAGPFLESEMWQKIKVMTDVQFMGLDVWNGTLAQLSLYKNTTGITFPLLKQAGLGNQDYVGAGLSDMVVIDQEGYVRLVINGEGVNDYPKVFEMITSLQNKTPIVKMVTKTLYYGRSMNVGQVKTQEVTVTNTGAGTLDITGMSSSIEGLVMSPEAFTLPAYTSKTVTVTYSPTQAGTFSGDVTFLHNNQGVAALKVELIELTVEGQVFPSISLAQNSFDLGQSDLDKTISKVVTITNAGPGVLTVSDVQSDLDGVVISNKAFTVQANESKDIAITFQPKVEGDFSGVIQVMSDDPNNAILNINLSGTGVFIPADPRADFDGSGTVDFSDFVSFVQNFGSANVAFDFDGSGRVDFADFLTFTQSFGKSVTK